MNASLACVMVLDPNFLLAVPQYYAAITASIFKLHNLIGLWVIFLVKLSNSSGIAICLLAC